MTYREAMQEAEKTYLCELMRECRGKVEVAAGMAKLSEGWLYKLLERHGIARRSYKRRG